MSVEFGCVTGRVSYASGQALPQKRVALRVLAVFAAVAAVLLAGSCASTPAGEPAAGETERKTSSAGGGPAASTERSPDDGGGLAPGSGTDGRAAAGNGFGSAAPAAQFDLSPRNGRPVFVGVANRLRDREEEEAAALRHIAEQASRYEQIAARYRYIGGREGSAIGYVEDIDVSWNEGRAEALTDSVEILQRVRTSEATFLLGSVSAIPEAPPISVPSGAGQDGPAWINNPPRLQGYLVTVGVSQRNRRPRQTVDAADEQALAALLLQSNTTLRMVEDRRSVEGQGTEDALTVAQEASAQLAQFYIAARHISPNGQYVYSLAVARER